MAIYDNLPYTNFHELNADWLLKQMKEAKAKIDEYQEVLDQFEEDYTVLLGLASAMTVAGSNVTVAGTLSAAGLIGNLTGNVTGNLTGNVTGNLTGTATLTSNFTMRTDITTADADDYMPSVDGMAVFKTGELSTHIMRSLSGEYFIIIAVKEGSHGWQIAYCPYGSSDIFFRTKFSSWTNWMKITATTAS